MSNSKNSPSIIQPMDADNQRLVTNVHPADWVNPTPSKKPYALVVIGGGPAGLVTASIAAALGIKVALIEKHLLGGDCLNYGCVPSKSLIHSAKIAAEKPSSEAFIHAMARLRQQRADISVHDAAQRFKALGIDVFLGSARFTEEGIIEVKTTDDKPTLRYKKAVICTGARAALLPVPGLDKVNTLTNETVFSLTERPERLGIIGTGPIGSELAQAFAKLGTQVVMFDRSATILPRENPEAAAIVQRNLEKEQVQFFLESTLNKVESQGETIQIHFTLGDEEKTCEVDQLLVAAGRSPNVEHLGLDNVGVHYDKFKGVKVDEFLQTDNARIYAAGDVCFPYKFTHTADALAQIVIQNALFPHPLGLGRRSTQSLIIPWCTYTSPEIAHVGQYATELDQANIAYNTIKINMDSVDRAVVDEATEGFAEVHIKQGSDQILGATVVANNAGDIISTLSLIMTQGLGLKAISQTIFPYPTQAEILKKLANQWQKEQFTEGKKRLLKQLFKIYS